MLVDLFLLTFIHVDKHPHPILAVELPPIVSKLHSSAGFDLQSPVLLNNYSALLILLISAHWLLSSQLQNISLMFTSSF